MVNPYPDDHRSAFGYGDYPVVDAPKISDLLLPAILFTHQLVDLVIQVPDLEVRQAGYRYERSTSQRVS
jgi:hypothetical protein